MILARGEGLAKSVTKRVRCTEAEAASWDAAAGGNFSAWAREVLNAACGEPVATTREAPLPLQNGSANGSAKCACPPKLVKMGVHTAECPKAPGVRA